MEMKTLHSSEEKHVVESPQDEQNKYLATPMNSSINMHSPPQSEEDDELEKQFKYLEDDWDSMKITNQSRCRCSSDLNSSLDLNQLFKISSPRHLISSLQRNNPSSSGEKWKVRTNDLAFMEILMERRSAIERGGLKGRNLYEALERESEMSIEDDDDGVCCSCCSDLVHQEGEQVRSLCFCCSSSYSNDGDDEYSSYSLSSPSAAAEKVVKEKKIMVVIVGCVGWRYRGRRLVMMVWLAFGLAIFALCMVWFRRIGGRKEFEDGVALFPT